DYFQVLKVEPHAPLAEIRSAFYRESRSWHPDRYVHLEDDALKADIHRIYKRVAEAWAVLGDEVRRARYRAHGSGPERESKLGWTEQSEADRKRAREEEVGSTPNGRRYHAAAMAARESGRDDEAVRSFKAALMYEPANELYKEAA